MTDTHTTDLVARLREWDHCWPARWLDTAVPQAADTIERLTRERDAEKADAAKWFAEYMALSHKQKGPVPDAALQARIAELTRERDEARVVIQEDGEDIAKQVTRAERAEGRVRDLNVVVENWRTLHTDDKARIAKLEAALKPFAAMPCGICENDDPAIGVERCSDDTPVYVTRHDHGGQTVTAGHFRAARAALEDTP